MTCFGANDDTGRLCSALLRCPQLELSSIPTSDTKSALWLDLPDASLARLQHSQLAETLLARGVEVVSLGESERSPNLCFCRDQLITMPCGLLLAKFSHPCRVGEEQIAGDALRSKGVSPWPPVAGSESYEGGDFVLAEDRIMLAGCSERTSLEAIQRLSHILHQGGVRMIVPIEVPDTFLHLDCGLLPIGKRRLITAFPLPNSTREILEGACGFRVIAIPEQWTGANRLGLNILFLNPDVALVPKSAPNSLLLLLHEEGIQSIVLDVSEFEKGGGGIHCLVGVIGRAEDHTS